MKGVSEVQAAPLAQPALEMVLIRLIYASDLPDPADLLKQLKNGDFVPAGTGATAQKTNGAENTPQPQASLRAISGGQQNVQTSVPETLPQAQENPAPQSFRDLYALCDACGEIRLAADLYNCVHVVKYKPGHIEIRLVETAPADIVQRLHRTLPNITGERWQVSISKASGEDTLAEQDEAVRLQEIEAAKQHPQIESILKAFPGSQVKEIIKNG